MNLESKKDRFSIRKLTIGVASVLLGFTFMGVKGQTVKADTLQSDQNQTETKQIAAKQDQATTKADTPANNDKLATYAGLKSFLRDDLPEDTKTDTTAKTPEQDNQTTSSITDEHQTEPAKPDQNNNQPVAKPNENDHQADASDAAAVNITAGDNSAVATATQQQKPQTQDLVETANLATTRESSVNVGSWKGLTDAFSNVNIHEINIINNIKAGTSDADVEVKTRDLVIKSAEDGRYIIDFQRYRPRDKTSSTKVNITYENLDIYSCTYYGLMQTSSNKRAIVNFRNVNFVGSQMMYVGEHTEIHFYGTNTAQTVKTYTNVFGTSTTQSTSQQLFEFTQEGGRLIFEDGTQFTGTTYSGNVVEMSGGKTGADTIDGISLANNNQVIVKNGAVVTLNPKGGAMPDTPNTVENTNSANGIVIYSGQGSVDIQGGGTVNINVGGTTDYAGTINNRKAKAINLSDSGSSLTVGDGGNLNIVTNGNISDRSGKGPANVLVNIGGNLTVGKAANFNITGKNMGNFAGTLMNIGGSSDITGSNFKIQLTDDPGTGKLTLLNPSSNTQINNPHDFLLDTGANDVANILSTGNFTLNSVRLKQPGASTSNAFRTFGFKGNSNGTLSTISTAIEGISPSDETAAITLINGKDLAVLEFVSANEGFLTIDPISDDDIIIDDGDNEVITGYANEGGAYISAVMPDNSRLGNITSPYYKEAAQNIKYAAVSADSAETSGAHQGKFKFTITIPKAQLASITAGSMVTLTATKNFVQGDPSLEDPQNPQSAKLYSANEIAVKKQEDAVKAINEAATAAKQKLTNLFGSDTAKAQPYIDAIDEWVTKSTTNDPTSADSVYGTSDSAEIVNRRDTAIAGINDEVTKAEAANVEELRTAAKTELAAYAQKANQYLGTTDDSDIADLVNAANDVFDDENSTSDDVTAALAAAKANILASFKTKAEGKITTTTNSNTHKITSVLALSSEQKEKYQTELESAADAGKTAIDAAADLDTAGTAYQTAKNDTDKVYATANTVSDLRKYKNTLKHNYPSLADQLESESATYEAQIDNGTSDLAAGKAALDQIVAGHNTAAVSDLQAAYDAAKPQLEGSSNQKVQDALTAAQDAITAVGTANSEEDMAAKKEAAQTAIDKLNALIALQNEATSEKAKYAAMYPSNSTVTNQINTDIDAALATGIDNITAGSTTKDNLAEVQTAGIVAIDRVGAKAQLGQKALEIEEQINNLPGLSAGERDEQIQAVKDLLTNDDHTGYQDQIDAATSQDAVNTLTTAGLTALNNLLADQTLASERNNAIAKLQAAQTAANAQIDATGLSAADKAKFKQDIQNQVDQGISNINTATAIDTINDAEVAAENGINGIVTNARTQNTALQSAQAAAISELTQYAQTAKTAIDNLPADQLSPSEKETYKEQIDQAVTAATNAINAATTPTDVTSAKTIGKTNIDSIQVAADLAAAKAKALKELTTAQANNKQAIDDLFTAGKIDADKQAELKGRIDDFYNNAVAKVTDDTTTNQIVIDKTAGINAMNGVVTDAADTANQELTTAKDNALDNTGNPIGLNNLAAEIKDHIEQDNNLGPNQKLAYQAQVDAALNKAKADVAAAKTTDQVAQAATNGRDAMLLIKAAADLKSAQIAAERALLAKHDAVIAAINQKVNIDNDGKAALIAQVESAYNAALAKVDNPAPATIAQVNSDRDAGIDNMQNVLINAGDLDSSIKEYQDKLDQVAQAAVDRVNKSAMTADAKETAITAINAARDYGKEQIAAQDNLADIKIAEAAGEAAILEAEKETSLTAAKAAANQKIDDAVATAKQQLRDAVRGLSADEIAAAEAAINTAAATAHNAINSATSEAAVTTAENLGETAIYQEVAKAGLAANKRQAKEAIQAAIDNAQFNEEDRQRAESIQTAANNAIDAATTSAEVDEQKQLALDAIANVKTAANLNDAKDKAIAALDKELNGDGTPENPGVLNQIANNSNLTSDEIAKYQDQARNAYTNAVATINGSQDESSLPAKERAGILAIDQALVDATLQDKKNAANSELDQAAKDADAAIDQLNLDQTKKDNLHSLVASELEKAKNKVNAATDEVGINAAVTEGKAAINNLGSNATDEELTQAATNAKNNLQSQATDVKAQIAKSYQDGKLDQDQYNDLNEQVQTALDNAITAINRANNPAEVTQAAATGATNIAAVASAKDVEEALNTNLAALQAAADQATQAIDASSATSEQKEQMKAVIEAERVKAADKIKEAKETTDPITNMAAAKDQGITTIANISQLYDEKDTAIKDLKQKAAAAKAQIAAAANNPADAASSYLSVSEVAAANAAVDAALSDAISAINAAPDQAGITAAQTAGETAITNSTLPAQLTAEKNKQIAAINAYAAGPDGKGAIEASNLTTEQKAMLEAQIEVARKKAVDKINNVQLPANPVPADLTTATTAISDAEKGTVQNGAADFGEAGIAAIVSAAKDQETLNYKSNKIAELEQYAADAKHKIEQSGLPADKQQEQKALIDAAVDTAKAKITAATDTTAVDAEFSTGEGNIDKVVTAAQLAGQKSTALDAIKDEQAKAIAIVNKSSLTSEQKQAAIADINSSYDGAKASVEAATDDTALDSAKADGIDKIKAVLNKGNSYPHFANEIDNTKDLATDYHNLALTDEEKAQYSSLIAEVENGISDLGTAADLGSAVEAYDRGRTALNKLIADKQINNAAKAAKDKIDQIPDDVLSKTDKANLKEQVDAAAKKTTNAINEVVEPNGDVSAKAEKINEIMTAGMNDISAYDTQALTHSQTAAKDKLDQEANTANTAIDNSSLTDEQKAEQKQKVQAALTAAKEEVDAATDQNGVNTALTDGKQDIDDVSKTTELLLDKNQAIQDLQNAADEATTLIDSSNLSDEEKTTEKCNIIAAVSDAQAKINQATTSDDIQTALTDGKEYIGQIVADVNLEHAKNEAKQDLAAAADNANEAIDNSSLTDEQKAEQKQKVQAALTAAQGKVDEVTDQDGISAVVTDGKAKINEIVTNVDLQQAKNEAKQELAAAADNANTAIDNSSLTDEQKTEQKEKVQAALTAAQDKVDAAADSTDIATELANGKTAINDATGNTSLLDAQNKAKQELQLAADAANTSIDNSSLTDEQKAEQKEKVQAALTAAQGKVDEATDQNGISAAVTDGKQDIDDVSKDKEILIDKNQAISDLQDAIDQANNAIEQSGLSTQEKTEQKQKLQDILTTAKDKINHSTDSAGVASELTNDKALLTARQDAINKIDHAYTTAKDKLTTGQISPTQLAAAKQKALANLNDTATSDDINNNLVSWLRDIATAAVQDTANAANQAIDSNPAYSQADKTKLKAKVNELLNEAIKDQGAISSATDHESVIAERDKAINEIIKYYTDKPTINHVLHDSDSSSSISAPTPTLPANDASAKEQTLLHNAYIYDASGKRANKLVLKAGSTVKTYGTKEIAGQTYLILHSQGQEYYLIDTNVTGKSAKLNHNAYVYNRVGKRIGTKSLLKKGRTITIYGSPVKIAGKIYYIIGAGEYIKAANVNTATDAEPSGQPATLGPNEKPLMHNAYLYNEHGERIGQVVLTDNSIVEVSGTTVINGREFTKLTNGYYVASANITGTEQELVHNAAIYNRSGKKVGNKVITKGKQVTVYGDPVTIKGNQYYIIGRNQYLQVNNF
ncbi:DUF1542 domain-containing protein [Lactobacillus sp. ESL0680]|uniref:DUF1542 domain-containing protein n=1 Tax=Lactobacillus sp. ESL0680 TaxID=2983210 RepID=UPI0023F92BDC|nr:DUF1542 domain-containing protein [Lactobacillus sp. ESL0680]WEV39057.1 DUF1542 domain-containing protein [Lactobacillus sp. ESL0680]